MELGSRFRKPPPEICKTCNGYGAHYLYSEFPIPCPDCDGRRTLPLTY